MGMATGERRLRPIDLEAGVTQGAIKTIPQANVVAAKMCHRRQRLATSMYCHRDRGAEQDAC
jgi:hypothetical protein